jgi:hypothetical protein
MAGGVGIQSRIGRRPIVAREYAYDRADKLQTFSKGWDEALAKGWTVVSMKDD